METEKVEKKRAPRRRRRTSNTSKNEQGAATSAAQDNKEQVNGEQDTRTGDNSKPKSGNKNGGRSRTRRSSKPAAEKNGADKAANAKAEPKRSTAKSTRSNGEKNNASTAQATNTKAGKTGSGSKGRGGRKAKALKIIPLGGMGEVGKNMTVFEYGDDIMIVDCGVIFPDGELLGIDYVIPDTQYLAENKDKIRGIVITHGHEDHIGGLPFIIKDYKNVPIYAPRLAQALIEHKFDEHNIKGVHIQTIKADDKVKVGCFEVSFLRVCHSIADAMALAIKTPVGMVVHTGDFKIDHTPLDGQKMDLSAFSKLGDKGVLLLMSDSTNAERPGYTMSEQTVTKTIDELFDQATGRVIVATFSSNINRIQQVVNIAEKRGRRVFFAGSSIERISEIAMNIGYLKMKKGTLIDDKRLDWLEPEQVVIITTGSQGEPMSGLVRMATDEHRQISIHESDMVIISASPIPGNEKNVSNVIDKLYQKGANVIYNSIRDVHVSGHACQEEQKLMMALTRPKFFIPAHGEFRQLRAHSKTAEEQGIEPKNIVTASIGEVIEVTRNSIKKNGEVNAGVVFVDGSGIGDVGNVVLKDRRVLSEEGLLIAIAAVNKNRDTLMTMPDIISRGFVYVRENEKMMAKSRQLVKKAVEECLKSGCKESDWSTMKTAIRSSLRTYLYNETGRRPMILPIIVEI